MRKLLALGALLVLFSGLSAAQPCSDAEFVITRADWFGESNLIEIGIANTGSVTLENFTMTAEAKETDYGWTKSIDIQPYQERLFLMGDVVTTPVNGLEVKSSQCPQVTAESEVVRYQNSEYGDNVSAASGEEEAEDQDESSSFLGGIIAFITGLF